MDVFLSFLEGTWSWDKSCRSSCRSNFSSFSSSFSFCLHRWIQESLCMHDMMFSGLIIFDVVRRLYDGPVRSCQTEIQLSSETCSMLLSVFALQLFWIANGRTSHEESLDNCGLWSVSWSWGLLPSLSFSLPLSLCHSLSLFVIYSHLSIPTYNYIHSNSHCLRNTHSFTLSLSHHTHVRVH